MDALYKEETYKIIGAAMHVHSVLGSGFLELVYQEALEKTFIKRGIPYKREKRLSIMFEGEELKSNYIADFVCYDKIIVELKATECIANEHIAQTLNYLKATNYKVGLILNFGATSLQHKRLSNTK